MDGSFDSIMYWVGFAIVVALALYAINAIFGGIFNARSLAQAKYPHRIATELPRVPHPKDRRFSP